MENNNTRPEFRMLVLICTPKLADSATELFLAHGLPIIYRLNAEGTASSEIMDALGLGSTDKCILISNVAKSTANGALKLLHKELRLDAAGSGIAFTMPLTGASNLLLRIMSSSEEQNANSNERKDERVMTEPNTHSLIATIVNRGFGEAVMNVAREAGASGGTIIHSRCIESEESASFWGLGVQEEKEIVLIIADIEDKMKIMTAIGEKHGIKSDAKGLIASLPIDAVCGI